MNTTASHFFRSLFFAVFFAVFAVFLFGAGYYYGTQNPERIVVEGVANVNSSSSVADFGLFWQAWDLVSREHPQGIDVASKDKVYGAIRGLLSSLNDPYSEFFNRQDGELFQQDVEGNFGGIGAEIGLRQEQLVIIAPLKDSPADRAGLKAGDKVFVINGTSTDGLSLEQSVSLIRGEVGSKVKLTVYREEWDKPRDMEIVRDTIVIPTLDYEIKDGIAIVSLYSFNGNAGDLFHTAAARMLQDGVRGMVLDLRNNPGGYLEVAVDLAGWVLPRGTLVVSEVSREGLQEEFRTTGAGALADMPVVVLINKGSASASEILAGALRDQRKVSLVGEQSYGKGTIQEIKDLVDGSFIKLTIANWVLPSGHVLEHKGLAPDVQVELTEEDFENDRDPQLEKAIEVLTSKF